VIVEILDPPFAHARQVRMFERYRCAHHGLPRQVGEAGFGRAQEAFGHVQPSVFGQIDELLYQVAPRGRALGDQRHQRGFFRASTLAKASLRMALQSAGVSSLSAPLSPSNSFASSCSSALRFSSARISSRTYSLTLL
jgi:hypothetical protein